MTETIGIGPVLNRFAQDVTAEKTVSPKPNLMDVAPPNPSPRGLIAVEYRLVIEKNAATGSYVYKTLNSFTGEVVSQVPAEDVSKMAGSAQYAPGLVVSAKA
jgi:flagellar protein FlaG